MGDWNINIQGVGPHHNNRDYDVDKIIVEFVRRLQEAGHQVSNATVTTGSKVSIPLVKSDLL